MQYRFTSKLIKGFMLFAYDEEGVISRFENHATLNDKQWRWVQKNFPFAIQELEKMKGEHGKLEEDIDLTFENFWKLYNYKKGKVNTREKWNTLSDLDKYSAISYIKRYQEQSRADRVALLYPERYIKYRRWEDEK